LNDAVTAAQQPHLQQEPITEPGASMLAREDAGDSNGDGAAEEPRSLSLSSLRGGGESVFDLSLASDNIQRGFCDSVKRKSYFEREFLIASRVLHA
jgi:hypothetical protein